MKLLTAFLLVIPMCLMLLAQNPTQQQPAPKQNADTNASTSSDSHLDRNQNGLSRKIKVRYVTTIPAGATARCQDKTYSYSDHISGSCAGHGGVEKWLKPVTLE